MLFSQILPELPTPADPGGDASVILAVIALLASFVAAAGTFINKKLRAPADILAEKKLKLDEKAAEVDSRESLLDRMQKMLDSQQQEHKAEMQAVRDQHAREMGSLREEFERRLQGIENKFGASESRNRHLIEFTYEVIKVAKANGLGVQLQQIPNRPDGIYIY